MPDYYDPLSSSPQRPVAAPAPTRPVAAPAPTRAVPGEQEAYKTAVNKAGSVPSFSDNYMYAPSPRNLERVPVAPSERPRERPPNPAQRFVDNWMANDSVAQSLAFKYLTNLRPEDVKSVMANREARANQYPPQGAVDKIAATAGSAGKQILDPVAIIAARLAGTPLAAAAAGGLYEYGNTVASNVLRGDAIDYKRAIARGAAGAAGAGMGDKLFGGTTSVVPEIAGRVIGTGTFGEGVEGLSANAYAHSNPPRQPSIMDRYSYAKGPD